MSEATEQPQDAAKEEAAAPTTQQPQRPQIEVDTDATFAAYANFCRVTRDAGGVDCGFWFESAAGWGE